MSGNIDWRESLAGPANKERYIRDVLNIDAAKSSKEYRNTYRYLGLIEQGKRSGSKRFAPVIEQATKEAIERNEKKDGGGGGGGGWSAGEYSLGQTVTETVHWQMRYDDGRKSEERQLTRTVRLQTERMTNDANERGIGYVIVNDYYSDGDYYDEDIYDYDAWWEDYAEIDQ